MLINCHVSSIEPFKFVFKTFQIISTFDTFESTMLCHQATKDCPSGFTIMNKITRGHKSVENNKLIKLVALRVCDYSL